MNHWLELSIIYANQRNYLDDLFAVYPVAPEGIRDIDEEIWEAIEEAFGRRDDMALLQNLLRMKLFPIKDPYVAYLRRDKSALQRNPRTLARLCGRLYEMGLDAIFSRSSEPKEFNRQIGPLFRRWINKKSLGIKPVKMRDFEANDADAILDGSDSEMLSFAREHLGYRRDKGLDFIGRFKGRYVVGEAKFLTDFGGHQNAQFNDAMATLKTKGLRATAIAILDGVLYIKGNNRMYREITTKFRNENIMSSLVLREFLYQL